jgi:LysR family transcriptional regulator, nitrogen assimilation regulatory protein
MNLKQLEYFVQVAELGSFSRAARVLDIAQPALSRQVRALETDLRETLLLRNGRGVALTDAGRRLLERGAAILQQVAQAREELGATRDEPVGRVTIGLPPSIARQLTLPLIEAFQRDLPKARVAIVEGMSTHVAEWITSGRVDLGLLYNPEVQPGLEITPVLQEALYLVSRRAGGKAARDARQPLPMARLAEQALIMPERSHAIRRLLETQAAMSGLKLSVAWEVSSVPAILDLVCAGHGQAVLTASAVAASPRASELRIRPIVEPQMACVLCLAVSATRRPSPLARRAGRMLSDLAAALPAAGA